MSDYQPIYDAVRSRITGGDISQAVERALDFSHQATMAMQSFQNAASEYERPSAVFRPILSVDGDHWCALYGKDLQSGVAGFGKSPADAMWDFDKNWHQKLAEQAEGGAS
jgi:hypothetical protein